MEQQTYHLLCIQRDTTQGTQHPHPQVSDILHNLLVHVLIQQSGLYAQTQDTIHFKSD